MFIIDNANPTGKMYYTYSDYLGSIVAITDDAGDILEEQSFDPWGRPRNPDTWELLPINITDALVNLNAMQPRFDRGYTGHEIMAGFGLINMNGRLYDPYLQRFLSPDIHVQDPSNSQSYNKYSYVLNNPLRYTDPSGYSWWSDFWDSVREGFDNLGDWLDGNNISFQVGFNSAPDVNGYNWSLNGSAAYSNGDHTFGVGGGIGSNYTAWGVNYRETDGFGVGIHRTSYGFEIDPYGNPNRQIVGGLTLFFKN